MTSNETTEIPPKNKRETLPGLILSLLIFAAFTALLFVPAPLGYSNSTFALILDLFKGTFVGAMPEKTALIVCIGMYVVLLICTVAAFFAGKSGIAALNFFKIFVCLGANAFFAGVALRQFDLLPQDIFYDPDTILSFNATGISLLSACIALIALSFLSYKGRTGLKLVSLLLAAAFLLLMFAKFFEEYTLYDLFGLSTEGDGLRFRIAAHVFRILAWATLVNLGLAVIGMILPRSCGLDLFRSAILLLIALIGLVALAVYASATDLLQYPGTLGYVGIAAVQFAYSLILLCILHSRKLQREAEEDAAEDAAFSFDENNQMMFADLGAQSAQSTQPSPDAQSQQMAKEEAESANRAFEEASQITIEELERRARGEDPAYESAIRDEKVYSKPEESFNFNQAAYDSRFNREYADYAAEQERKAQQPRQSYPYAPPYGASQPFQTAPPYPNNAPYAQQSSPYYAAGYAPDAFINSLTPAEKDEFDRLFISRIYGENKRLPAYRVGSDNREFFLKVFVFMGRYRNLISDGLLEKIYNYSNTIR